MDSLAAMIVCISEKEITAIFESFLKLARERAMTLGGKFNLLTLLSINAKVEINGSYNFFGLFLYFLKVINHLFFLN